MFKVGDKVRLNLANPHAKELAETYGDDVFTIDNIGVYNEIKTGDGSRIYMTDAELILMDEEGLYILVHKRDNKVVTSEANLDVTKNTQETLSKCGFETTMYKKVV